MNHKHDPRSINLDEEIQIRTLITWNGVEQYAPPSQTADEVIRELLDMFPPKSKHSNPNTLRGDI